MQILRMVSYYVTQLQGKIPNLVYCKCLKKTFLEMSYHVRGFMAFGLNNQCYGQNRGIVCDNILILFTHMYHGMGTMLQEKVFLFEARKIHFQFFERKKGVFCEATTK